MIHDIVTIDIPHSFVDSYKVKYAVFFNQESLIKWVQELGEYYLSEYTTFVVCFDTTPLEQIKNMKDYKQITDAFPDSHYIFDKAIYIGNYKKEDWLSVVDQCLSCSASPYKHSIEYIEGRFTK